MLSDKGSIKTARISVETALVTYRRKLKLISLIVLIIGAVGVAAYIVVGTVLDVVYNKEPAWVDALLAFAVPFTLGLIGFVTIVRLDRRAANEGASSVCEFFADCLIYSAESISCSPVNYKVGYSDAVYKGSKGRYGYVYILSRAVLFPFCLEDLTKAELNTVLKLFRSALPDGAETVELEKYRDEEDKNELS